MPLRDFAICNTCKQPIGCYKGKYHHFYQKDEDKCRYLVPDKDYVKFVEGIQGKEKGTK